MKTKTPRVVSPNKKLANKKLKDFIQTIEDHPNKIWKPRKRKTPTKMAPTPRPKKIVPPRSEIPLTAAARVSGPVWTVQELCERLGTGGQPLPRDEVVKMIDSGLLLSLPVKADYFGAFPIWQFVEIDGQISICPGLPEVLNLITSSIANRWTLASWLQQPNDALLKRTPLSALHEGDSKSVQEVAKLVRERWAR
jgi:hypothetical protein